MKDKIISSIIVITILTALSAIIIYSTRWFSQAVTPVNVIEVEPGVKCAQMITDDGAAIDCWKTK